jgi:hypothetical protein
VESDGSALKRIHHALRYANRLDMKRARPSIININGRSAKGVQKEALPEGVNGRSRLSSALPKPSALKSYPLDRGANFRLDQLFSSHGTRLRTLCHNRCDLHPPCTIRIMLSWSSKPCLSTWIRTSWVGS